nr:glycosyltransferase family 2 protein [Paracoccus ravus]
MANYQAARWIGAAMRSVLAQSYRNLELIVCDDASGDDSVAIARAIAARDDRVRVLPQPQNAGPAAARNSAIEVARGEWIAIVDSDDLIHPSRLARLWHLAMARDADLVADDMVCFGSVSAPRTILQPLQPAMPFRLDAAQFLLSNSGDARVPGYGYLKPMISRRVLDARRYDPSLRIGEDFALVMRLLHDGARYIVTPDPLYAYRRHDGSISHRMTVKYMEAILTAHRAMPPMRDAPGRLAAQRVQQHLSTALRYERLVAAIKSRHFGRALRGMLDPAMIGCLGESLADRHRRRRPQKPQEHRERSGELPDLPPVEGRWPRPPADDAAHLAAMAAVSDFALPETAPDWAIWLRKLA